jgi:hypothetical protein
MPELAELVRRELERGPALTRGLGGHSE